MKALGRGSIASYIKIALDVAWVVVWIAALAVGLAIIAYGGLVLAVQGGLVAASVFGPVGATGGSGGTFYNIAIDSWQVAVPALLGAAVMVFGGLIVIRRLKALFQSFTTGEPFVRANADHLRAIWIALAGIELARMGIGVLTHLLIAAFGQPAEAKVNVALTINLTTWFVIAVLVVLAEVFREGARLKEEQELTI